MCERHVAAAFIDQALQIGVTLVLAGAACGENSVVAQLVT